MVIIAAYNEGQAIQQTLSELLNAGYEVVVVDDASSDDTVACVKQMGVTCLRHPINLGQGAALQTGMTYAYQQDASWVIHFDADGQHRVEDIPRMLEPILSKKADVVLGSRFLSLESIQHIPRKKRILLKGAIWVNGLLTGMWLSDAHNGLRALNRKALSSIHLSQNRMAHASEILLEIKQHQLRYTEVPVTIRYTEYSQAKGQSAWNALNILFDMVMQRWVG